MDSSAKDQNGRISGKFKYQKLARTLAGEIRRHFVPGERWHSEPDLCKLHGVSRNTVRSAIELLVAEGLIERRGRAGSFVGDYHNHGFDDQLFCAAMPIRNHLWDQIFLSLSRVGIDHQRFALICDLTSINTTNLFAEELPEDEAALRLRTMLAYRPRTLVLHKPELLEVISGNRGQYRNLILLREMPMIGLTHTATVIADTMACWRLAARHAAAAGYKRVAIFLPPNHVPIADLQAGIAAESFGLDHQQVFFKFHPDWEDRLVAHARRSDGPLAVLTNYDWGGRLVKHRFTDAGIDIPHQAGIYGMQNTPWSMLENMTTVWCDADTWAEAVFSVDNALDEGESHVQHKVPPSLIERATTLPAPDVR